MSSDPDTVDPNTPVTAPPIPDGPRTIDTRVDVIAMLAAAHDEAHAVSEAQGALHVALVAHLADKDEASKKAHLASEFRTSLGILGVAGPVAAALFPVLAPFVGPALAGLGAAVSELEKPTP